MKTRGTLITGQIGGRGAPASLPQPPSGESSFSGEKARRKVVYRLPRYLLIRVQTSGRESFVFPYFGHGPTRRPLVEITSRVARVRAESWTTVRRLDRGMQSLISEQRRCDKMHPESKLRIQNTLKMKIGSVEILAFPFLSKTPVGGLKHWRTSIWKCRNK